MCPIGDHLSIVVLLYDNPSFRWQKPFATPFVRNGQET